MTADFQEKLTVMRSLNDKRMGLTADQVVAIADMTQEQRAAMLAQLVERDHTVALVEDKIRKERESR